MAEILVSGTVLEVKLSVRETKWGRHFHTVSYYKVLGKVFLWPWGMFIYVEPRSLSVASLSWSRGSLCHPSQSHTAPSPRRCDAGARHSTQLRFSAPGNEDRQRAGLCRGGLRMTGGCLTQTEGLNPAKGQRLCSR